MLFWVAMAVAQAFFFYANYWRLRDRFDETGRYYDPIDSVVYVEQAGVAYVVAGCFCLLLALPALVVILRRGKARRRHPSEG